MFTLSILFINILIKDFKILTDNKQRKKIRKLTHILRNIKREHEKYQLFELQCF